MNFEPGMKFNNSVHSAALTAGMIGVTFLFSLFIFSLSPDLPALIVLASPDSSGQNTDGMSAISTSITDSVFPAVNQPEEIRTPASGQVVQPSAAKVVTSLPKALTKQPPPNPPDSPLPVRLKIAKIKVNAALEYVGLTAQGAVGAPKGPTDAAWFNRSPHPGDAGSAVITGHFGPWKNGSGSVFDDLHELAVGDTLSVENKKGGTTMFVVRELRTYGEHDDASAVFGPDDGKSHLNLITCAGVWNKAKKSYSNRLVVFADKMYE